jgi:hypothetical protein
MFLEMDVGGNLIVSSPLSAGRPITITCPFYVGKLPLEVNGFKFV